MSEHENEMENEMESEEMEREPGAVNDARAATPPSSLRKGSEVVLHADAAAFEGGCVARHDGMAVFVSGCVPGDTVRALVLRKRKRHAEARTLEVIEKSADRVEPPCVYFGDCGGCKWQNLAYAEQLRWKRQHVIDSFERIAGLAGVEVRATIGCNEEYFYRNKMEFSFGDHRWLTEREIATGDEFRRDFALGLHVPGRFDKVLDVHKCWLQSETSNRILNATRAFALEHELSIYNTRSHTGLLRNLVIRESRSTGEVMAILVTSDDADDVIERYTAMVRAGLPEVTTLVQGINRKKAQIAFSEEIRILFGKGTITESVAGNEFTISPFSFFQTNTLQAERLYQEALDAAALDGSQRTWDLYCGAGTITLAAARRSRSALGVELNAGAILDARVNAERNGIANAGFIAGDMKNIITNRSSALHGLDTSNGVDIEIAPDVVITDPPRAGMHEDVVRALLELAPERISYVSCNPTTQARDCAILAERYTIDYVQPVDMFPQTYHVETVARLSRRYEM